jgi:hypothetical protein
VASAYRFGLQRNEILLSLGESTNAELNTVDPKNRDMLIRRNIVRLGHDDAIWARHRVIAEVIRDEPQKTRQIKELLHGLAHVAATQIAPSVPGKGGRLTTILVFADDKQTAECAGVNQIRRRSGCPALDDSRVRPRATHLTSLLAPL